MQMIHRESQGKMKKQKNIFKTKEQDKTSETVLNEMEISNLTDKEIFKSSQRAHPTWEKNG